MIVSVKGADLHCTTRGEGPACLVLSSIGTRPYEVQIPTSLSDRLKLVFVDLRGAGRSTGDPAGLTFDVLASDLEAVRSALGVDRVAVLGHSILGMLAIEYARRRPSHVSHVVVAGTPPRGDMAWLASQAAAFFERDATEERKQVLRERMALSAGAPPGQAFFAQSATRFFDATYDAAPLFAGTETNIALLAHLMGTLARGWDVLADVSSLEVPILVAHGRYDYTVPHVLWDEVIGRIPHATLRIFERSGHQPFFEEPERFADEVTEWMQEV